MPNMFAFLSYVFITAFTPGPNNIMSMSNASQYGFIKSLRFNLGIFAGFLIIMGLCTLFSATLYSVIPTIKPYMLVIGASYILWLAWKTVMNTPNQSAETSKTNTFIAGFLLQFVNPKVILYGITTISTFVMPYYNSLFALAGFSILLAFIGFVGTICWSLFGSLFEKLLSQHTKFFNTIMGILLAYCAISLFL